MRTAIKHGRMDVTKGDKNCLNLFLWSPQKHNFEAILRELIFMD